MRLPEDYSEYERTLDRVQWSSSPLSEFSQIKMRYPCSRCGAEFGYTKRPTSIACRIAKYATSRKRDEPSRTMTYLAPTRIAKSGLTSAKRPAWRFLSAMDFVAYVVVTKPFRLQMLRAASSIYSRTTWTVVGRNFYRIDPTNFVTHVISICRGLSYIYLPNSCTNCRLKRRSKLSEPCGNASST